MSRIPTDHHESLQILEYSQGGFYYAHDDASRLEYYAKNDQQVLRTRSGERSRSNLAGCPFPMVACRCTLAS